MPRHHIYFRQFKLDPDLRLKGHSWVSKSPQNHAISGDNWHCSTWAGAIV